MIEIVQALDDFTNTEYSGVTRKLFGFCELAKWTSPNGEQPQVSKISNKSSERAKVSLDDKYKLITWVRLPGVVSSGNNIEGNDWGFGLEQGKVQSTQLRWIVAHRVELGEDFFQWLWKAVPILLEVTDYQVVSIDKNASSIDTDHEQIYRTELGEANYEKHRFTWNLYAINLNVEYIPCEA